MSINLSPAITLEDALAIIRKQQLELRQHEQKIDSLVRNVSELGQNNDRLKQHNLALEKSNSDLERRNDELAQEIHFHRVILVGMKDYFYGCCDLTFGQFIGDPGYDSFLKSLPEEAIDNLQKLSSSYQKYRLCFGDAPDSEKFSSKDKDATKYGKDYSDKAAELCAQIDEQVKKERAVLKEMRESLRKHVESGNASEQMAGAHAALSAEGPAALPKPRTRHGRTKSTLPKRKIKPEIPMKACPFCGEAVVDVATLEQWLRDMQIRSKGGFNKALQEVRSYKCDHCGAVMSSMPNGALIPFNPKKEMSLDALLFVMSGVRCGITTESLSRLCFSGSQLGHHIPEQLAELHSAYFEPLHRAIRSKVAECDLAVVDETPYPVLESQQKGSAYEAKKRREAIANAEDANVTEVAETDPETNSDEESRTGKPYVCVIVGVIEGQEKVVIYYPMKNRSADQLIEALGAESDLHGVVADGYAGYRSERFTSTYPHLKFQADHVHARRELFLAANLKTIDEVKAKFEKANPGVKFIEYQIKQETPFGKILAVLALWSLVFRWENQITKYIPGESKSDRDKRILEKRSKHVKPLMMQICALMTQLAETEAYRKKNGTCWYGNKTSQFGPAVAYFMNRREQLLTFLHEPDLICHSNWAEQAVRIAATMRRGNDHMQSEKGMKSLCKTFSLYRTLEINGIEPESFLLSYGRAFYLHCVSKRWWLLWNGKEESGAKNLKNPKKHNRGFRTKWDMAELGKDFDASPWIRHMFGGKAPSEEEIAKCSAYAPKKSEPAGQP